MAFEGLNYPAMWEKAAEHYQQGLDEVDENDIVYSARKGTAKMQRLGEPPEGLEELWDDLGLLVNICQDYVEGNYRDIRWQNIQTIAGAVSYFVTPFDLVPDSLPKIGYLDDALVLRHALKKAADEIERYRDWSAAKTG